MADQIISKRCSHCKQVKTPSDFRKNRIQKDGFCNQCKSCEREYRQTEKGKASHNATDKKFRETEKGKKSAREKAERWRNTEKGKRYFQSYNQTEKAKMSKKIYRLSGVGKFRQKVNSKTYNVKHPKEYRARMAVKYAVKVRKVPHIKTRQCICCGNQADAYHHHKGYAEEYQLDVIPVCYVCHYEIHANVL